MAIKKSELYSKLWRSCDELRGGMDASNYKDYVLVLLFIKYVSDKYAGKPYAEFTVPEGASFQDMVALKGKSDIGDQINKKIVEPLASTNKLTGMPDFNDPTKLGDGKEMVDRLTNLIDIFNDPALDFSGQRAGDDDILGDAYEYLMRHFATESGKSKGQFYTPAEVSRVMAQVIGIADAETNAQTTVYDPTCGSGSLLLKVADAAKGKPTLYGQEKDSVTAGLARMNMILHENATAEIMAGNTLTSPKWTNGNKLKQFDYVVANPPFSDKKWMNGLDPENDPFDRFSTFGIPPAKQGDYAYLLHIIRSLKSTGRGACILPHGVLFRGNAEAAIRKTLIDHGYIAGIIGLPANLFYGTGIPACILVLDKAGAAARKGLFMIDASKGFAKDGPKNRLRARDMHRITDVFRSQRDVPGYARFVTKDEILAEDYNLNIPRYIDSSEPEDLQDIEAHLKGGIPAGDVDALQAYWDVLPNVRDALFKEGDRPGYLAPKVVAAEVKPAILNHAEFIAFGDTVRGVFDAWCKAHETRLKALKADDDPKALIHDLSEDLLARFKSVPLIDAYEIYQHLMTYWSEVMQDDVYLLVQEGWAAGNVIRELKRNGDRKSAETPDITLGRRKLKAEIIPPALIVARFFAAEQDALNALEAKAEEAACAIEELDEEHGQDDGLLAEARTDKGKLTAKSVKDRMKEIRDDADAAEEMTMLKQALALIEAEAEAAGAVKAAQAALDEAVVNHYAALTEDEVKTLIVEDKWVARLRGDVTAEVDRVSQELAGRVKLLAERYAMPLPALEKEAQAIGEKVAAHLKRMGFAV